MIEEQGNGSYSARPKFLSWGRYPRHQAKVVAIQAQQECRAALNQRNGGLLPVGLGRSYGDSCLLKDGTLLQTTSMNRAIAFDTLTGVLTAESGISLAEILDFAVPQGFFLPVTPGTKFVTLGGAIANDIHGKNHGVAGCFGNHVVEFELVRSDGSILRCSPESNPGLFSATIGGLGLTGVITWARVRLIPIVSREIDFDSTQFHGIDEFIAIAQEAKDVEYTVSWIDTASTGKNFARGLFYQGTHSRVPGKLNRSAKPQWVFPFEAPEFFLTHRTVGAFNSVYFHKQRKRRVQARVDYEPFFYPLDTISHWNRLYGRRGLLQFQCVIPWESAREGVTALLDEITRSRLSSFLSVLKAFGDVQSPGLLSFPKPGITLAMDFPIRRDVSFSLYMRLADMTRDFGGRLYPAKDAAMTESHFKAFYPQWEQLEALRDPAIQSSFWQRVTGIRGDGQRESHLDEVGTLSSSAR